MSGKHPLMQPLHSDSLKPRPAAQAVWVPAKPMPVFESAEPDETMTEPASVIDPLPAELSKSFKPETEDLFSEEELLAEKENDDFFQFVFSPQPISSSVPQKKNKTSSEKDAIPNEQMPVPVCVPLYEDPAPERKSRWWLWLIVPVLAAGGVFAAWKCGYLPINLP